MLPLTERAIIFGRLLEYESSSLWKQQRVDGDECEALVEWWETRGIGDKIVTVRGTGIKFKYPVRTAQ